MSLNPKVGLRIKKTISFLNFAAKFEIEKNSAGWGKYQRHRNINSKQAELKLSYIKTILAHDSNDTTLKKASLRFLDIRDHIHNISFSP
jgi:hypothetical protein